MWPKSTSIWRLFDLCLTGRAWSVYHNNQKMNHSNVLVNNGDHFSCYEKLPSHRICTEPNHIMESDQSTCPAQVKMSDGSSDPVRLISVRPLSMPKRMPPCLQDLNVEAPPVMGYLTNNLRKWVLLAALKGTERQELIAGSPFGNPLGSARPPDGRTTFDPTLDPATSSDQLGAWVTGVTPARRSLSEQYGPVELKRAPP